MPVRKDLRPLYPADWAEISRRIRFERADGRCERCRRPHGWTVSCLPDGRWLDAGDGIWRTGQGVAAAAPSTHDMALARLTHVVLAAAHLDHNPANNDDANLAALCGRCHLAHDLVHHQAQRWVTYRRRAAIADLFLGGYSTALYPLNRIGAGA